MNQTKQVITLFSHLIYVFYKPLIKLECFKHKQQIVLSQQSP